MLTERWKGVFKLAEECGEVVQCVGKLAVYPTGSHPDGKDWRKALTEEIADVIAAAEYVAEANLTESERDRIRDRVDQKLVRFRQWGLSGVRTD